MGRQHGHTYKLNPHILYRDCWIYIAFSGSTILLFIEVAPLVQLLIISRYFSLHIYSHQFLTDPFMTAPFPIGIPMHSYQNSETIHIFLTLMLSFTEYLRPRRTGQDHIWSVPVLFLFCPANSSPLQQSQSSSALEKKQMAPLNPTGCLILQSSCLQWQQY